MFRKGEKKKKTETRNKNFLSFFSIDVPKVIIETRYGNLWNGFSMFYEKSLNKSLSAEVEK